MPILLFKNTTGEIPLPVDSSAPDARTITGTDFRGYESITLPPGTERAREGNNLVLTIEGKKVILENWYESGGQESQGNPRLADSAVPMEAPAVAEGRGDLRIILVYKQADGTLREETIQAPADGLVEIPADKLESIAAIKRSDAGTIETWQAPGKAESWADLELLFSNGGRIVLVDLEKFPNIRFLELDEVVNPADLLSQSELGSLAEGLDVFLLGSQQTANSQRLERSFASPPAVAPAPVQPVAAPVLSAAIGANSAPAVDVTSGQIIEGRSGTPDFVQHSTSGQIVLTDENPSNTVTLSFFQTQGESVGNFSLPSSASANSNVTWNYSVSEGEIDYLAAGEQIVNRYQVEIVDNRGAVVTKVITVVISGTNDRPVIGGGPDTSSLTETNTTLSDSGTLTVGDLDLSDFVSVTRTLTTKTGAGAGNAGQPTDAQLLGMFTVNSVNEVNPTPNKPVQLLTGFTDSQTLFWHFNSGAQAFNYLAQGEKLILTFTVTARDSQNTTGTETVTITITGANDAPVVTSSKADHEATVTEDTNIVAGNISASDTIVFQDLDLIDTHTATSAFKSSATSTALPGFTTGSGAGASSIGTFSIDPTVTENNTNTDNNDISLGWKFELDNKNTILQSLAKDQTITQVYTVTLADNHKGTVTQEVTVTIAGTNDVPTITVADTDASGAVTEDASTPTLTDKGTIAFNDVDLIDVHTTKVTPDAGNTLGGTLTMGAVTESATTESGTVEWTYEVDNKAVQYLASKETVTETFTVAISDGKGGTVTQDITVTITGTNDAPTLTAFSAPAANVPELTEVEITFSDLLAKSNAQDIDGDVEGFKVTQLQPYTQLRIGPDQLSAMPFHPTDNYVINAGNHAYVTLVFSAGPIPDPGTQLDAFTVVALDDNNAESATPVQVDVVFDEATTTAPMLIADGDEVELANALPSPLIELVESDQLVDPNATIPESTAVVVPDLDLSGIEMIAESPGMVVSGDSLIDSSSSQVLQAALESNEDGALSLPGDLGDSLSLWQDANGDGVGELAGFQSLDLLGISSISLISDGQVYTPSDGVLVLGEAPIEPADVLLSFAEVLEPADATLDLTAVSSPPPADAPAPAHAEPAVVADAALPPEPVLVEAAPADTPPAVV